VRVMGVEHGRIWRQLVSCAVAYAFALQIVLFGFAAPPVAARAADQDALNAALCLHDQGAPSAPADTSGAGEHCKFCPGGSHVFTAPELPHYVVVRAAEATALSSTGALAPPPRTHTSAQPRGPPLTA